MNSFTLLVLKALNGNVEPEQCSHQFMLDTASQSCYCMNCGESES